MCHSDSKTDIANIFIEFNKKVKTNYIENSDLFYFNVTCHQKRVVFLSNNVF